MALSRITSKSGRYGGKALVSTPINVFEAESPNIAPYDGSECHTWTPQQIQRHNSKKVSTATHVLFSMALRLDNKLK